MEKLLLEEDMPELAYENLINTLIRGEWELIDQYNAVISTLEADNNDDPAVLKELVSELYTHIGQLEKLILASNPGAEGLQDGE